VFSLFVKHKIVIMLYSARYVRKNVLYVVHEQLDPPMQLPLGQAAQHAHVSKSYLLTDCKF